MPKRRGKHEGTRYRRPDGLYVGRVQYEGVKHQVSSTDRLERDRLLRELIRDLAAAKVPATAGRRKTLRQVTAEWLADRALTRPKTYPTWRSYARHLADGPLGGQVVATLTGAQVTQFLAGRAAAAYAPSTVRQIHRTLQAALNWAVDQDVPVPAAVLRLEAPAVPRVDRVQLSPAQVGHLFRTSRLAGDPLEALWRLTWYTSTRDGELLALTWDHADTTPGGGWIRIVRNLVKSVDGEPRCHDAKTASSRAVLAIPADAVEALARHLARQEERRRLC